MAVRVVLPEPILPANAMCILEELLLFIFLRWIIR
jgi:hypothetical protein